MILRTLPTLADLAARQSLRAHGYLSRTIRTSVGKVHAIELRGSGDLPPVVFLHGFSAAAVHYYPLLSRLKNRCRRLIAIDLPGHGFSDHPVGGMDTVTISHGLIEALDSLIGEPVVLFGNSMGGMAAVRYAAMRPRSVRGLMLISPGGAPMDVEQLVHRSRTQDGDLPQGAIARYYVRRNPLGARQLESPAP